MSRSEKDGLGEAGRPVPGVGWPARERLDFIGARLGAGSAVSMGLRSSVGLQRRLRLAYRDGEGANRIASAVDGPDESRVVGVGRGGHARRNRGPVLGGFVSSLQCTAHFGTTVSRMQARFNLQHLPQQHRLSFVGREFGPVSSYRSLDGSEGAADFGGRHRAKLPHEGETT